MTDRPTYNTTKRQIWFSFAFAWAVIFLLAAAGVAGVKEAVDLANIVVPSMVMLIAAMLGIHRLTGSMDFRAAQERAAEDAPEPPPYDARAEPGNSP